MCSHECSYSFNGHKNQLFSAIHKIALDGTGQFCRTITWMMLQLWKKKLKTFINTEILQQAQCAFLLDQWIIIIYEQSSG